MSYLFYGLYMMDRKYWISFLSCICLIIGSTLSAQKSDELKEIIKSTSNDSIKADAYYQLARTESGYNLNQALRYADTASALFQAIDIKDRAQEKSYTQGVIYYESGLLDTAIVMLDSHYRWAIDVNNLSRKSYAIHSLSKIYREKGDLNKAIEYALEGLHLSEENEDIMDLGYYATELGNLYSYLLQYDIARAYFEKAYKYAQQIEYPAAEAVSLRNLAENAIEFENTDRAKDYLFKSLSIDSLIDRKIGLARGNRNLGLVHYMEGNLKTSLSYYNKAEKILGNMESTSDEIHVHLGIANTYLELGDTKNCFHHINQLKEYDNLSLEQEKTFLELESKYHELVGNVSIALAKARAFYELDQKWLDDQTSKQIVGSNVKFETDKKEKEIALLNAKNENTALRLSSSKKLSYTLGITSMLLLGFLYSLYRLNKKIQSQKDQLGKALSEKEILLREIHHRVKNNLQVVSSLLYLQGRSLEDKAASEALQEGQNRVKSMSLIHQKLYQEDNLTGVAVKDYFEKLVRGLFDTYNISNERVSLDLDISDVMMDVDTLIPLGLIVNELITNALKHGFKPEDSGTISVTLKEENQELFLKVVDDGIGVSEDNIGKLKESFGYELIQSFSDQLDADIAITNNEGTAVEINIRDYKIAS